MFDGWLFAVTGIPGFADSTNGLADVSFFNANYGGGLLINDDGDPFYWLLDATDGKQYYSGSEAAPTFTIGNYNLHGLGTPGEFALSIAAIPEPESWALLLCGFGGVGAALRVRRRRAATI